MATAGLAGGVIGGSTGPAIAGTAAESDQHLLPDGMGVDVRRYAHLVTGDDWTAAFVAAISEASQAGVTALPDRVHRAVLIPAGRYGLRSVEIPRLVKLIGLGGDLAYYGDGTRRGGVSLVHLGQASGPMLDVTGPGATLRSLTLVGNGVPSPVLRVTNGFESTLDHVRCISVPGTALWIEQIDNSTWRDVFVDDSGTPASAAVVLKSPKASTNTNSVTLSGLTIERSAGTALDIAWGDTADYFVEFVRFVDLHVEGPASSTDALVRIGSVRHVEFVSPFVYGGGPDTALVAYRARSAVHPELSGTGGVRFIGGVLLGVNAKTGARSHTLVTLGNGNDVAFLGTRFAQHTGPAVRVDRRFGPSLHLDGAVTATGYGTGLAPASAELLEDQRVAVVRPTVVRSGPANQGAPAPTVSGSDQAGSVAFGTGPKVGAGPLVTVEFAQSLVRVPTVTLTPLTAAAARLSAWVSVTTRGFTINAAGKPSARTPRGTYRFAFTATP